MDVDATRRDRFRRPRPIDAPRRVVRCLEAASRRMVPDGPMPTGIHRSASHARASSDIVSYETPMNAMQIY
ncbi:hypothetical protein [Burkholderia pseudomultivorans]|uniref:hypothetical protein n=1 Tax=Burkholderia pseudomultivorans TaxID=1207504 RepID=UPI000756AA39|nr:hypothetical protein [Burkholderia pseudomultivorans]KVG66936.1 hypothetical protein WS80_06390 [Burkholderia pseudomultivorans]